MIRYDSLLAHIRNLLQSTFSNPPPTTNFDSLNRSRKITRQAPSIEREKGGTLKARVLYSRPSLSSSFYYSRSPIDLIIEGFSIGESPSSASELSLQVPERNDPLLISRLSHKKLSPSSLAGMSLQ